MCSDTGLTEAELALAEAKSNQYIIIKRHFLK
jgi:hypothetical protein